MHSSALSARGHRGPVLVILALVLPGGPLAAATAVVPTDHATIQEAVEAVQGTAGALVRIDSNAVFDETVTVLESVTIEPGAGFTPTIRGTSTSCGILPGGCTVNFNPGTLSADFELRGVRLLARAGVGAGSGDRVVQLLNESSGDATLLLDLVTIEDPENAGPNAVDIRKVAGGGGVSVTVRDTTIELGGVPGFSTAAFLMGEAGELTVDGLSLRLSGGSGSGFLLQETTGAILFTMTDSELTVEAPDGAFTAEAGFFSGEVAATLARNVFRFESSVDELGKADGISMVSGDSSSGELILDANLFLGSGPGVEEAVDLFPSGTGTIGLVATNNVFHGMHNGFRFSPQQDGPGDAGGTVAGVLTNNTIHGSLDSAVLVRPDDGTETALLIHNNLLTHSDGWAIEVGPGGGTVTITNDHNGVFANAAGDYSGAAAGPNDVAADPAYVDAASGDLRLVAGSPMIDRGDNGAPALPATDADGEPRIQNGTVDIGAYEGGEEVPAALLEIPTLSAWALALLAAIVAGLALLRLRGGAAFPLLFLLAAPALAGPPVPVSPGSSDGGVFKDTCPTFLWSPGDSAGGYELVVYRLLHGGELAAAPALSATLPAGALGWTPTADRCLRPGGRYAWSLRGLDDDGAGAWSEPAIFEVARPSRPEVAAALETLRGYLEGQGDGGDDLDEVAPRPPAVAPMAGPAEREPRPGGSEPPPLPGGSRKVAGAELIRTGAINARGDNGVVGQTDKELGIGIWGASTADFGMGIVGESVGLQQGVGAWGISHGETGYGVIADAIGVQGTGIMARAHSTPGTGVYGYAAAESGDAVGVLGESQSSEGKGVHGLITSPEGFSYAVVGTNPSTQGYGVAGIATATTGLNYGVYGSTSSASGYGGFFAGRVHVTGTLSKGGGSFTIDHPLDPANRTLSHSFVESPDMMNVYNGNVALDGDGAAWVELPEWFEALNRDFRYQLTALLRPAPGLHVAETVAGNRFRIAGGEPGMEVSWQVTGIRQDAFARHHPILVEEDKGERRGRYLHPEAHGQPPELAIGRPPASSPVPEESPALAGERGSPPAAASRPVVPAAAGRGGPGG